MGLILLAAFIAVPLVEIAVFIQVGGWIGLWPTLAIVVLTAIAGTALLRSQGLATAQRARQQMDRGVLPAREMFDGICLVFAGALLLTPGFVTDAVGLLLFVQPVRDALRAYAGRYIERHGHVHVYGPGGMRPGAPGAPPPGADPYDRPPHRRADGTPHGPAGPKEETVAPPPNPGQGWGARGRRSGPPGTIEGDYRDISDDTHAEDGPDRSNPDGKGGAGQS
jgi:UPF0716 protein FxsA